MPPLASCRQYGAHAADPGADYDLSGPLYISGELRHATLERQNQTRENGSGAVDDFDYNTLTPAVGIGLRCYRYTPVSVTNLVRKNASRPSMPPSDP